MTLFFAPLLLTALHSLNAPQQLEHQWDFSHFILSEAKYQLPLNWQQMAPYILNHPQPLMDHLGAFVKLDWIKENCTISRSSVGIKLRF